MKKTILAGIVLATLFSAAPLMAVTKCVGYGNKTIIFHDKNDDGKYESVELVTLNEPTRVITMEEAKQIIATFPKGTE